MHEEAPARGSAQARRTKHQKKAAQREASKLSRAIQGIRGLYWVAASFYFLLTLALMFVFFSMRTQNDEALLLMTGVTGVMTVLMVAGAIKVAVQPFFWSLLLAGLSSADFAIRLAQGQQVVTLGGIIGLAILVLLWAGVAMAVRIRRLVTEHPNMRINSKLIAEDGKLVRTKKRELTGSTAKHARGRARKARNQGTLKLVIIGVIVVGVLIGGWLLYKEMTKPPPYKPPPPPTPIGETVDAFIADWNAASSSSTGAQALASYFEPDSKSRLTKRFTTRFEDFGWTSGPPDIELLGDAPTGTRTSYRLRFTVADARAIDPLELRWLYEDETWRLKTVKWPPSLRE